MKRTALVLALAGLATGAQAATWTLDDTSIHGLRSGVVALSDEVGAMGSDGDVLFGAVTDHLNDIGLDSVAVGSWDAKSVSLGGNSIDLGLSHEAYAGLDGSDTAYVEFLTSVSLDYATIVDTGLDLDFSGYAPVRMSQSFIITPELGENMGDLVTVNLEVWANHEMYGDLAGDTMDLSQDFYSNYVLYLNGTALNAGSHADMGLVGDSWSFMAHIGDVVSLQMGSQSQVGGSIGGLQADHPHTLLATSQANLSMTVTAVPEPETWAMLIAGIGLVGLRLRRKHRSTALNIGA